MPRPLDPSFATSLPARTPSPKGRKAPQKKAPNTKAVPARLEGEWFDEPLERGARGFRKVPIAGTSPRPEQLPASEKRLVLTQPSLPMQRSPVEPLFDERDGPGDVTRAVGLSSELPAAAEQPAQSRLSGASWRRDVGECTTRLDSLVELGVGVAFAVWLLRRLRMRRWA